ncbi:MAG: hypothetical protein WC637_21560, partial [Victivallales bacterium]
TPLNFVASFVLSLVGEECKRGNGIDEVRDKAHDKDWGIPSGLGTPPSWRIFLDDRRNMESVAS